MKIFVAGHTGLVGSAIVGAIEARPDFSWVGATRAELDLLDKGMVQNFVEAHKPDAIIVAAAKVGGIGANSNFPVDFLAQNLQIELNITEAAFSAGIQKFLFLGSSCIYPKFATQPLKEEYLLSGALEITNEPYAIAKIAGIKLVAAYRKQFDMPWISAMPCNIYGPRDNFNLQNSHVLPALIRKLHEAKLNKSSGIPLWGSGAPMREFLFSEDLAEACLFLLENYSDERHINVGSGEEVAIRDLAALVADVVGYTGEIFWDHSKPDGTPRKILDSTRINELGWHSKVSLREGVEKTYAWYLENTDLANSK